MIQNRESVVASGNTVDVDRQDAAKSLLAIQSSPPAFTGEQNFPYFHIHHLKQICSDHTRYDTIINAPQAVFLIPFPSEISIRAIQIKS